MCRLLRGGASPGIRVLHKRFRFKPGSSQLADVGIPGNDPTNQASLKSSMDFGRNVSFEMFLRHVGELPLPATDAYYELSARLAWRLRSLDLSVSGFNLLHDRHLEYAAPSGAEITRSVLAEVRWTF
jgi:iron complex outermembrane receptor protein